MVKVINGTVSRPYYTKINVGLLKNVGKMRLTLSDRRPLKSPWMPRDAREGGRLRVLGSARARTRCVRHRDVAWVYMRSEQQVYV
jgi:hypothetical protein